MTIMETETTTVFTVQPFASIGAVVSDNVGDLMDAVLSALEDDPRAIAPVVSFDCDRGRIEAIFQIEASKRMTLAATTVIFESALRAAGSHAEIEGVSIVEGDDPDLLP